MNVKVIEIENQKFAFRIPEPPTRFRSNCKWGCFVKDTIEKGLSEKKADDGNYLVGTSLEGILVWHEKSVKTIPPHYFNEEFQDIYLIPTGGELHEKLYHPNASELIMFSMHRSSRRFFLKNFAKEIGDQAFKEWVNAGMPGDPKEYGMKYEAESYFRTKLRFEFVSDSSDKGDYYWLKTSLVEVDKKDKLAATAIIFGQELFNLQQQAKDQNLLGPCYEPSFTNNDNKVLAPAATTDEF